VAPAGAADRDSEIAAVVAQHLGQPAREECAQVLEELAHAVLALEVFDDRPVAPGETSAVGDVQVQCRHTPGHTPGSQCFHVRNRLVAGDTLFIQGCGRCDLPGGDPAALFHSLTRTLNALDDATVLYPGHNYAPTPTSTLADEKQHNPFLRLQTIEQFRGLIGL
jgi:glyoxylase-like metal-dependent hydrolase (beta-lactamase superfamily II)